MLCLIRLVLRLKSGVEYELYWDAVFKDLFAHSDNFCFRVVILMTPKQEVERKSEPFCGIKFYHSKVE